MRRAEDAVRIDVHAHYFPPDYAARIAGLGARVPDWQAAPSAKLTLAERLDCLDAVGIDMQVLSVALMQPYFPEARVAADLAMMANDRFFDLWSRADGRLATFAALPLPHVDASLAELERCQDVPGFFGVTLGCSVLGRQLDDPAFAPVYQELDRLECPVFIHPMMQLGSVGMDTYRLDRKIGALFEDTIAAARLVKSGVVARYPGIKFIIAHLGGTIPYIWTRANEGEHRDIEPDPEDQGYRNLWYDTSNSHLPALQCGCQTLGADRLVFGTDFPYLGEPEYRQRVAMIEQLDLPAAERDELLGGRVASWFHSRRSVSPPVSEETAHATG